MRKIFIVGGNKSLANWAEGEVVDKMEDSDVVFFDGGEDISPVLYFKRPHPKTFSNPERDAYEIGFFSGAIRLRKPMVGICRGAQLLCVQAGGVLVQHQSNDNAFHQMFTDDGAQLMVSSDHHQAQYPWRLNEKDYKVIGWTLNQCQYHWGEEGEDMTFPRPASDKTTTIEPTEVEVVVYHHIKALAIQPHPEWLMADGKVKRGFEDTIDWFRISLDMLMHGGFR